MEEEDKGFVLFCQLYAAPRQFARLCKSMHNTLMDAMHGGQRRKGGDQSALKHLWRSQSRSEPSDARALLPVKQYIAMIDTRFTGTA